MTVYFSTSYSHKDDKTSHHKEPLSKEHFMLSDTDMPDYIRTEGLEAHGDAMLLQHASNVGKMCADFGAKAEIKVTSYMTDDGGQVIETKILPANHEDYSTFVLFPSVGRTVTVDTQNADEVFLSKVQAENLKTAKEKVQQYNRQVIDKISQVALSHTDHINAVDNREIQAQRELQRQNVLRSMKQDKGYVTNLISFMWSFMSYILSAFVAFFCVACNAVIDVVNYIMGFFSDFQITHFKSFANVRARIYSALNNHTPLSAIQNVIYRLLYVSY